MIEDLNKLEALLLKYKDRVYLESNTKKFEIAAVRFLGRNTNDPGIVIKLRSIK